MNEISDYWAGWFVGFTDGEGCFSIRKDNRYNSCANHSCQFQINLRDDDKPILEKIRAMLGIGKIYDFPACTSNGINHQPHTAFCVQTIKDCARLVKVFDKYPLQAKKKRDFAIWKEAVAELQKPVDYRDADLLEYCFQQIKQVKRYNVIEEIAKPKIESLQLAIPFGILG